MEKDKQQKPMCKICGKSFPSGMSLGGHMRSHFVKKSSKKPKLSSKLVFSDDDDDNNDGYVLSEYKKKRSLKVLTDENSTAIYGNETRCKISVKKPKMHSSKLAFYDDYDDDNEDGYALSEYNKRSLKVSTDENGNVMHENVTKCKECGKEFPSVRSLCGHMRWHTVKPSKKHHLCRQCGKGFDTIRALFGHMTHHSRQSRVLNEPVHSQSDSEGKASENFYSSSLYSSSSDIDSDEIEDAAIILMMLSRGMTQKGSLNLVFKETKHTRFMGDVDVLHKKSKMSRRKKLGTWGSCSSFMFEKENPELDDSFSRGYENKVEMKVSDDRVDQDDDVENEFSGFEIKNKKQKRVQPGENFKFKKFECDNNSVELKSKGLKKSKRHVCRICSKAFHTKKGLGAHKKAHKYDALVNCSQGKLHVDGEKEAIVDIGLKPWCVESDQKHVALVRY